MKKKNVSIAPGVPYDSKPMWRVCWFLEVELSEKGALKALWVLYEC